MKKLDIGHDFSIDPAGRYFSDGPGSGEEFREEYLMPALSKLSQSEKLGIVIDNDVEGYGSSFLVEGFAGIVKYGYMTAEELLSRIEIIYSNSDFEFYKMKILQYIKEATFDSEKYISTK